MSKRHIFRGSTAMDTNTHMYVGIFVGVGSTLCNNDKQVSNECLNTATTYT